MPLWADSVVDALDRLIGYLGDALAESFGSKIEKLFANRAKVPTSPLRNATLLLDLFLSGEENRQVIARDLEEQFNQEASDSSLGPKLARVRYWRRVIVNITRVACSQLLQHLRRLPGFAR